MKILSKTPTSIIRFTTASVRFDAKMSPHAFNYKVSGMGEAHPETVEEPDYL